MVKERKDEPKDDKKPKKESDLKKFLNKRSFIYLSAAVFFVVFIVPDMIAPSDLENKLVDNLESDEQNIAWNIVKDYKGSDNSGYNLFDTIITQIENAYPNEKILKHNDTLLEIIVLNSCYRDGIPECDDGLYSVQLSFETYDNDIDYVWAVDIETGDFTSMTHAAKKMMDIVDFYD